MRANRKSAWISVYKIAQRQNEALELLSELINEYLAPEMTLEEIENARQRLSSIRARIAELTAELSLLSNVLGPRERYDS